MINLRRLLYTILLILISQSVSSQDYDVSIEYFTIKEGLSQNSVTCILQDSKGYLWVGTQDGLNKYDGYKFKKYRHEPDAEHSLVSNYIKSICESTDSSLWIATEKGLSRYDFKDNRFNNYINNTLDPNSLHDNDITFVFEDSDRNIWIKSKKGLDKYNKKNNNFNYSKHYYYEFSYITDYNFFSIAEDDEKSLWMNAKDGLISYNSTTDQYCLFRPFSEKDSQSNEIFSLYIEEKGFFLIGTNSGLFEFDKKKSVFSKIKSEVGVNNTIRTIFKDKAGVYWIGTETGLAFYDIENRIVRSYEPLINNKIIAFGRVSSIMQDKSDILWIGTETGLFKIDRKPRKFKLFRKAQNNGIELSSNRIYSFYQDDVNKIWIGTRNFGINIFNPKTRKVKQVNIQNSNIGDNSIHSIQKDNKGNTWIGTSMGAYMILGENSYISFCDHYKISYQHFFQNNRISNLIQDKKGNYWFATFNGLILYNGEEMIPYTNQKNKKNEIADNEVVNVIERENGEIWVGTRNGISKYNNETDDFTNYNVKNGGLSNNSIMTLVETSDQTLWIGTETGLNRYVPEKDSFIYYTSKNTGFNNDYIYAIIEDSKKSLWMSTNKGIIKFNPDSKEVINFEIEDGLQDYEFNIRASLITDKGEIYFGGVNGVNSFFPDSIIYNEYAPTPLITKFDKITSLGKVEIYVKRNDTVSLGLKEHSFTIYFSVPEYTSPKRNKYKYRIKELNETWFDAGSDNFASYNELPSGEYTFEVVGSNNDGVWSEKPCLLNIVIPEPWWLSTIAYVSYIVLFALIIIFIVLRYNRNIRKENKVLQEKQKIGRKIAMQKELLSIKNKNISDSIHYAKRIIEAMIPSEKYFKRLFPDSFIYFKPKDIVSGDFYWVDKKDDKIFVAVVDCTGHGVPGAFMSIVGLDLLRNILSLGIDTPEEILHKLNNDVIEIFKRDEEDEDHVKDGMDVGICAINEKNGTLEFAGAINQLYILRDNNLIEVKGDRHSVGPINIDRDIEYTNHNVEIMENDVIYLFSDGYVDQFGGPSGKKFKYRRFRHLLLNIHKESTERQKELIRAALMRWQKRQEQVDDILIIGIKPKI